MNWTFILKKLTDPNVQEEQTLIGYILRIARRNLEVEKVLKRSIDLRKELMSLWNLTKMLRLPTNFTTKIRVSINPGNCDSTYAKSKFESNWLVDFS